MICYLHYLSAKRRLQESEKTVIMLGGERQAPEMVRAQRDFIQLETEYYGEQCIDWNFGIAIFTAIGSLIWLTYWLFGR